MYPLQLTYETIVEHVCRLCLYTWLKIDVVIQIACSGVAYCILFF